MNSGGLILIGWLLVGVTRSTTNTWQATTIEQDVAFTSPSGAYQLKFQNDGNLVLRDSSGDDLWSTGTSGLGAVTATMQADNNLVLRDSSGASVWASGTSYGTSNGVCVNFWGAP